MAALTDRRESPAPVDPPQVWMEPVRFHHVLLDGSWWPRSGDLAAELRVLVPALDQVCGPVTRLLLGAAGWTARPHEVSTAGRRVGIGYLAGQSPSMMTVLCAGGRTFTMFVMPPGPAPARPEWINPGGPDQPANGRGEDVWETEGGGLGAPQG
jgi:hypothetical protein